MELAELIRGAQEAMDRGDYRLAASACAHALTAYPSCLSAHRILGEAHLELSETDQAIRHFERALAVDPLNVVARLGLGVAAEERQDPGLAYAHYLHAWEINPALDQVRDQLARLREALGSDGRLHPTRAGLAGIYARSGQLGRAAAEWRAIRAADPESERAGTALAEVLWRAGDDAGAAAVCRDLLRSSEENARALVILSEIERRRGQTGVIELVERYQAVDPLGEIAMLLGDMRADVDLTFLGRSSAPVAPFDFAPTTAERSAVPAEPSVAAPAALASPHVPAPDLWDTLVRDLERKPGETGAEPAGEIQPFSWSDDDQNLPEGLGIEPFSLEGIEGLEATASAVKEPASSLPGDLAAQLEAAVAPEPTPATPAIVSIVSPEQPAATEPEVAASAASAPSAEPDAYADPFVTADGRVDLTVGWDELDRTLEAATPTGDATGFEGLLAELDAVGVTPFAVDESSTADASWEPFTAEDFAADAAPAILDAMASPDTAPAMPPAASDEDRLGPTTAAPASASPDLAVDNNESPLPADWVDIDEALIAAIPAQQPSGYTELLRHIDTESVPELPEPDVVDPLASPDLVGDPLDFDDLLAVTSRDGTAPLGPTGETQERPAAAGSASPASTDADAAVAAADVAALLDLDVVQETNVSPEASGSDDIGALLAELGAIEPFHFDEAMAATTSSDDVADFTDINQEFDPTAFDAMFEPAPVTPPLSESALDSGAAGADAWATAEATAVADTAIAIADAPGDVADVVAMASPVPTAVDDAAGAEAEPPPQPMSWPAFISATSELIDRVEGVDGLFDRLRAAKRSLIDAGAIAVTGSACDLKGAAPSGVAAEAPPTEATPLGPSSASNGQGTAVQRRSMAELGLDLTELRVRLIEDDAAAGEVASTLERVVAQGDADPLALRVLGEAYLRLGRTEQAAAQFRQAMLARRRAR